MTFVSGPYKATYGPVNNPKMLGLVEDGYTLTYRRAAETITVDAFGDTPANAINRGVSSMTISFILSEWDAQAAQAIYWPFSDTFGSLSHSVSGRSTGKMDLALASVLTLTACTGATHSPTSIAFPYAILSPDFDVTHLFASRHRKVAIQMTIYPGIEAPTAGDNTCDTLRFFTATPYTPPAP